MKIRDAWFHAALILACAAAAIGSGKVNTPTAAPVASAAQVSPGKPQKSPANSTYMPDRIVVKLKADAPSAQVSGSFGISSLDRFVQRYNAIAVERRFPHKAAPLLKGPKEPVDLSRIFVMKYSSPIDAFKVAHEIAQLPEVEYAEPWFIYTVSGASGSAFIPNDTSFSKQWGLTKVKADSAWNISQGDTSVVIGIIDTGVQWDHPDLIGNIWINPGESGLDSLGHDKRTNGIDDDGNGYIDDWHGWDFLGSDYANPVGDNDTKPQGPNAPNLAHGTHVAGIASASTNNVTGVAGIGYKCRILPVKASADNDNRGPGPYIERGFDAIVYAADMGAKVINCSWGGEGASQFEQDVVTYATQHGALIVAAAGNSYTQTVQFPASYDEAISVAATNKNDIKSDYSSYNEFVDVSAPGGECCSNSTLIYSTYFPDMYAYLQGTSMASPLVAGLAALVKSYFPGYSALQVGEQVRATCDNIYGSNSAYLNKLGKGRINALKALTLSTPSIRMTSYVVSDSAGGNNNGSLEPNEDFTVAATFVNYLQPTSSGATISLTSADTYVQVTAGSFPVGVIPTNGSVNNFANPFQVHIKNTVPPGHIATFLLQMTDGSYSDFQVIKLLLNQTYATMNVNNVKVTVTNNGRIGFNDGFTNSQGVGFVYGGENELFEGGLIIGTSATKLVDVVRDSLGGQDADFVSSQIFSLQTPGTISAQDGHATFTDDGATATNKLGIQVDVYSYAFTTPPDSDFVIARFDIKNTTAGSLSNVYAGLFFDWDMLPHYDTNKTAFDASRQLGYAWDASVSVQNPVYCGVRALNGAAGYRGLINTISLPLGRDAKWSWLSGGIVTTASTGDIHFAISSGPYTIAAGQKQMVGFALLGGKSLANLQAHADAALSKWTSILPLLDVRDGGKGIPTAYALRQNYPNPFNPTTNISYDIPSASFVNLRVFDILGREVATLVDGQQQAGVYTVPFDGIHLSSGVYYCRFTVSDPASHTENRFVDVKKLILMK
ncbi:MAG TPA: S8 family serine peptidase [Bacteroidota bacterium]|nr:S8 family serine peptidase [Bacteroidota bacterium]